MATVALFYYAISAMFWWTFDTFWCLVTIVQELFTGCYACRDEWPVAQKRALFLHCLGTEGQRLFYTLSNQGETMGLLKLLKHFILRQNVIGEWHALEKKLPM